ncbi:hypothetical protein [Pseudonocardia xishanensis]|uniref:Uncharacterized protein n=1 Tax=Pseudonocardia xishanensis TaxID=630995 RepID=A0ABP8RMG5_9PSEU
MRLGRKLAEGLAVDREADRLAESREPAEKTTPSVAAVTAGIAEELPAEQPVRA